MASIINATTSSGVVITSDNTGQLQLQTAGTNALNIDASQNVGIGTASPNTKTEIVNGKLQVNTAGSLGFAGAGAINCYTGAGSRIHFYDDSNQCSVGSVQVGGSDALTFQTGGTTERMRIDPSGNLLLGTTTARGVFTIPSSGQIKPAGFTVVSGGANYAGPAAAGQLAFVSWNNGSGYALIAFQGTNITTISSSNSAGGNNAFDTTNSFASNGGNGAAMVVSGGFISFQTKNNFTAAGSVYIMYLGG